MTKEIDHGPKGVLSIILETLPGTSVLMPLGTGRQYIWFLRDVCTPEQHVL